MQCSNREEPSCHVQIEKNKGCNHMPRGAIWCVKQTLIQRCSVSCFWSRPLYLSPNDVHLRFITFTTDRCIHDHVLCILPHAQKPFAPEVNRWRKHITSETACIKNNMRHTQVRTLLLSVVCPGVVSDVMWHVIRLSSRKDSSQGFTYSLTLSKPDRT